MWTAENIPSPAHPHPHPLPAACSFGDHFAAAAVSLSPSNLIGKPQACHSVPAAHIWTNALGENDTNLSVRWQRNDERGREALARGNNIQCSRRHLSWCSSQRCRNRINGPPTSDTGEWLQARAALCSNILKVLILEGAKRYVKLQTVIWIVIIFHIFNSRLVLVLYIPQY